MQCTPSRLHTSSCRTSFQVTRSRSLPLHDWPLRVRLSCTTGLASCLSASSYGRSSWSRTRSFRHYRGPRPTISLRCSRMLRASTGATRAIESASGRITCARRCPQPGRRFFSALRGPELARFPPGDRWAEQGSSALLFQTSIFSAMSRASSTSTPR